MDVLEKTIKKVIPAAGKKSILIVDDSDFIRERLVALCDEIESIGQILQAKNSEQAYNQYNLYSPDIIILEIHIPGDNGIKVLGNIRKKNKEVMIIILTDYPYEQYKRRCLELGADYFFDKSGDISRICEICESLVINK
jgi:DNA-binding NarL/FixJ family response regulator